MGGTLDLQQPVQAVHATPLHVAVLIIILIFGILNIFTVFYACFACMLTLRSQLPLFLGSPHILRFAGAHFHVFLLDRQSPTTHPFAIHKKNV